MLLYLIRRLVYTIPIALGVTLVVFSLVHLAPGDPISAIAPADAPPEVVERLAAAVAAALRTPEIKDQFARLGIDETLLGPRPFAEFIRQDIDKWAKVVKAAGVGVD